MPETRKHANLNKYYQYNGGEKAEVIGIKEGNSYYNPEISYFYPSKVIENPIVLVVVDYKDTMQPTRNNNYFYDVESVKAALDKIGAAGKYTVQNINKLTQNEVKFNIRILGTGVVTVILYTFIMLVFLYQSVYLYMEETKRLISVQYVLGHGKLSRYSEIIVMNLAPHAFLFMISIIFLSIPTKLIFTFCATFMIIEFLFMVYMIKKFERNTVIVVLKGE